VWFERCATSSLPTVYVILQIGRRHRWDRSRARWTCFAGRRLSNARTKASCAVRTGRRPSGGGRRTTGSFAAARLAPVTAQRLLVVFVQEASAAASKLDLRPAEAGANVLLVEPFDPVVFDRTIARDGLVLANPSQVAADLLTSPGRGPAEAEALLAWMKEHEDDWRS
jgi:hypothetical protein